MQRAHLPVTRALQLACALFCAGAANSVAAAELVVEWSAPAECPDREELEARVGRLIGNAVKTNLTATTDVKRTAGVYRARVRTTSASGFGERVVENPRCDLLADSVALVIAFGAGTSAAAHEPSANDEAIAITAAAHAGALGGPLPDLAVGVGGALSLEGFSSLRLELRGAYYVPQSATFAARALDGGPLGARLRLLTFGARGCRTWRLGAFELGPCVGAEVHHVTAGAFGGTVTRDRQVGWWALAGGIFSRLRLTKLLAICAVVEGILPLSRRRFVFSDVGLLHRASPFGAQLLVGPEVRF